MSGLEKEKYLGIARLLQTSGGISSGWLTPDNVSQMVTSVSNGFLVAIPVDEKGNPVDYKKEEIPGLDDRLPHDGLYGTWGYTQRTTKKPMPKTFHRLYQLQTSESNKTVGEFEITGNFVFSLEGVVSLLANVLSNTDDIDNRATLSYGLRGRFFVERVSKVRPQYTGKLLAPGYVDNRDRTRRTTSRDESSSYRSHSHGLGNDW